MSPRSAQRPDVPILVVCASRDRPDSLYRTAESFFNTSTLADMAVYVDADQINLYLDAFDWNRVFEGRVMFTVDQRCGPNAAINRLYQKHGADYRIFGVTPDDSRFQVAGWDRFVIENVERFPGGIGVVSPAHNDGAYCAYPYVTKQWLELVGWYAMPEAHSFVWDTCIELLGEATNIIYAPEHLFRMEHDRRHSENFESKLKTDEHAFLSWCAVSRREIVKKLRSAMYAALHPPGSQHEGVCPRCGALQ